MQPLSGTHTRIQMQRDGQALIPHGTLLTYDPTSGAFTAAMDFQPSTDQPLSLTPVDASGKYTDQNNLPWTLIR